MCYNNLHIQVGDYMEEKTLYDIQEVIKAVSSMLEYYTNSGDPEGTIKAAHLILGKVSNNKNGIELDSKFIEDILFFENDDKTKSINGNVFNFLRTIKADMKNVSFNNVHITTMSFCRLKNVEIDIQEIPNYDISHTYLEGVKVIGSLEGANIEGTNFKGYIGNLVLDPQKLRNKNLKFTSLWGIIVKGSFNDVYISHMKTEGFKGEIVINPQKVKDKDLDDIDFNGVKFIGNEDNDENVYVEPSFDGCKIFGTKFRGCIGKVVLNLGKLYYNVIVTSDLTGVSINGNIDDYDLHTSYFYNENGEKIYFDEKYNQKLREQNNVTETEKTIDKQKSKLLSIFKFQK